MSTCQKAVRPLARCLHVTQPSSHSVRIIRTFTSSSRTYEEATTETVPFKPIFDPATVTNPRQEKKLMKSGITPIGSRRRRAALKTSDNIPFEQLPYQCFQEARKVLAADREEKMKLIATERLRISNLIATDASNIRGGEATKQKRLDSMRRHLEYLKIQADINDPLIKKRFEDGEGDMNKPIYRYLADKKWREYQRKIIVQRINQLAVVPDVLPFFEPTADVKMAFRDRNVQPGEFIDSRVSEVPARLKVQVFDKGPRLVTVAVVDSDVPLVEKDNFMSRCHYLAINIPLSPVDTSIPLSMATEDQLVLPWLPPFAQKGSPYHRYSVFVIEQKPGQTLNVAELKDSVKRDEFHLKSFVDKQRIKPIGMTIFRSLWDEGTAGVMSRAGIQGADIEFKRKKVIAIKPKQKARGWEARHSGGKYLSLQR
ncbi:putative 54S ribosomal protein L35, mitochondrial [Cadophora sp. MPI-SDFR-AT-0126]|nr:putative 54S ribosomal protein L35, mitochondrial [Leotiomycetes sp. MPI-SDFR-AT-0126]